MRRVDSLEKTLMLGGIGAGGEGDDRGWDGWMASPTRWTWVWMNSGSWWWTGRPGVLRFMGRKELDTNEQLNWTELKNTHLSQSMRRIWLFATLWTAIHQAPLSMGIPDKNIGVGGSSSSRGSSQSRYQTHISRVYCIAGKFYIGQPPGINST